MAAFSLTKVLQATLVVSVADVITPARSISTAVRVLNLGAADLYVTFARVGELPAADPSVTTGYLVQAGKEYTFDFNDVGMGEMRLGSAAALLYRIEALGYG